MLRINGIHTDELGKGSEESEQNRKLQRNVAELVRRIDNMHQSANRVEDVFSEDLLGLRVRLREFALKLLHADPEKFGLKYLEIVWRKAWHEPVTLARQVGGASVGCVLLDSHLLSGLGQYHHLLLGLAELYGCPPGLNLDLVSRLEFGFSGSKEKKYSGSKWMLDVVARCLVWLGDLSRYRLEFSENIERERAETLAKKYYSACACIKPGLGLAYSQLASISRDSNAGIDPLFFYLKCVTSRERFDGGESNLRRLLDKSENDVNNLMDKPAADVASAYMVQLVANLVEDRKEDEVIHACQQSLSAVHQAIAGGNRVESTWLARLTACVVLVIIKLGDGSAVTSRLGLCQAWMLALTSHLAGMVVTGLGKGLWGEDWSETSISTEDSKAEEEEPEEEPDSKVEKKKRKKFVDMLRRRRVSNSGSSVDSDLSEDDEPPSISDDDFIDSDESDDIYFSDSEDDEEDGGSESDEEDVIIESIEEELPDTRRVVEVAEQLGMLPALNLCFVWLRAQPQVLAGMGDGGNQLWTKLARLFTLLNLDSDKYVRNDKISRLKAKNIAAPIDEEFYIRDADMFENQLKEIDWNRSIVGGTAGEMVARVSRIASWRSWLVDRKECTVRWREGEGRAVIVETAQPEKKNVMKHMAELWLKEEVDNLEKNQTESCVFVVDAQALVADLNMVKRVTGYKKFTVIVPTVVVRELDNIKKHVRDARLSIRWLERELSRGHKGLQPQEENERLKLSLPAPHRKEPGWARHCVLQCVAYFAEKQDIIFLTGDEEIIQQKDPQINKVLSEIGVRVEPITNFMERFLGLRDVARERKRSGNNHGRRHRRRWRRDGQGRRRERSRNGEEGGG